MLCHHGKKHSQFSILYFALLNYGSTSGSSQSQQPQQVVRPYISLSFTGGGNTLSIPAAQLSGSIVNGNAIFTLASQPSYNAPGNPTINNFVLSITGNTSTSLQLNLSFSMLVLSQIYVFLMSISLPGPINNPGTNSFTGTTPVTVRNATTGSVTTTNTSYNIVLYL
jgi:hypothetical protein